MRSGPNTVVRVEFMACHVSSQEGNVTHDLFVTMLSAVSYAFVSFPAYSIQVSISIDHPIM